MMKKKIFHVFSSLTLLDNQEKKQNKIAGILKYILISYSKVLLIAIRVINSVTVSLSQPGKNFV